MSQLLQTIAASELYTASSYMERVLSALTDIDDIKNNTTAEDFFKQYYNDIYHTGETFIFSTPPDRKKKPSKIGTGFLSKLSCEMTKLYAALLDLEFDITEKIEGTVTMVNVFYRHARKFHLLALSYDKDIKITQPRQGLANRLEEDPERPEESPFFTPYNEVSPEEGTHCHPIPRFYLPLTAMEDLIYNKPKESISFHQLSDQRNKRYRELLGQGIDLTDQDEYTKALEVLKKACRLKETSEVLSRIAWVYSLMHQLKKAKHYCLKAIRKDPDDGSLYNEMGCYMIYGKRYEDALKWFDRAKRCPQYEKKADPYVNASAVYLINSEFTKALEELRIATTLSPNDAIIKYNITQVKELLRLQKDGEDEESKQKNFQHDGPFPGKN